MTTTLDLPGTHIVDGRELTTHITRPCWLYVWLTTEADGTAWWSVHRSTQIRDDDHEWLQPVRDLIGDGEPLHSETIEDESMMGYRAELSVYAVAG